jgi:hypothetical protein
MQSSGSWSNIDFQFKQSWNTDDFGAVTFAVKTDNTDLDIYPYLENTSGEAILSGIRVSDYVVGSMDGEWQVVWIPLRDLLAGATNVDVDRLLLEFSWAGNVWLDEVKVVEHLVWPLPEFARNIKHSFGEEWFGGSSYLRAAADFSTGGQSGKKVLAAHAGKVVSIHRDSKGWKCIVVIQSEGEAFATSYTHIENLTIGNCDVTGQETISVPEVEARQLIGYTAELDNICDSTGACQDYAPHLHFELWVNPDLSIGEIWAGALLPSNFPSAFVDPALIDWQ